MRAAFFVLAGPAREGWRKILARRKKIIVAGQYQRKN
jgi:hypothetical protein